MLTNEQKILSDLKKGKPYAAPKVYDAYERYWFRMCLRYARNKDEAQDLMQVGVSKVFQSIHSFDVKKGSFKNWSTTIIIRESIHFLKKHHWQQTFTDLEVIENNAIQPTIFEQLRTKEIIEVIQHLPSGYRMIFNLFEIEGYSHKEIAELLDITVGTSKSQLYKAKKMLQTQIETLLNS